MIVLGAKGFAKEILQTLDMLKELEHLVFFDNVSTDIDDFLYNKFQILRTLDQAKSFMDIYGNEFILGVGGPIARYKLMEMFEGLGGQPRTLISPVSTIGNFAVSIEHGACIMSGVTITNSIKIGKGCLINLHCTIGHDSIIGNFTELSPGVHISGNCEIGAFCNLGTNSTILPKVKLGNNVIVGAGAVVTKDVPDNSLVVGVPGKVTKELLPVNL